MNDEERAYLEERAKAAARRAFYEAAGIAYTDGLGVLGVGSLEGGPASIQNAAYRDEWRRLCAEVVGE